MLEEMFFKTCVWRKFANRLEERHPFFTMLFFQLAVAVFLIAAVGFIALIGGGVIWLFYYLVGVL